MGTLGACLAQGTVRRYGLYGDDDVKKEWSAITEEEFWEGMMWGFVKFDG